MTFFFFKGRPGRWVFYQRKLCYIIVCQRYNALREITKKPCSTHLQEPTSHNGHNT